MARTSTTTQARQVARARLAKKAEQRRQREQAELEHLTDFETAAARRDQAETEMATAIAGLIALGNTVVDTAALTERTEAEIRRLRKLAAHTGNQAKAVKTRRRHRAASERAPAAEEGTVR